MNNVEFCCYDIMLQHGNEHSKRLEYVNGKSTGITQLLIS